jgi:hypothetical protein
MSTHDVVNEQAKDKEHPVTVIVNTKEVFFEIKKANGKTIKATAIVQGVQIKQDFPLFEKRGEGNGTKWEPISDDEIVTLHPKQEFRAVAPDDTSMY